MYIYIYENDIYIYTNMYLCMYVYTYVCMVAPRRPPIWYPPFPPWCGGGCFEMKNNNRLIVEL